MALITEAKPEKNFNPLSESLIAINSSKLAPAQKALSPSLFKTITLAVGFFPNFSISVASIFN